MIGKQIKKMRLTKGVSRYKLRQITNLHPETIVSIEEDEKGTIKSLETMATALDLEITFKAKHK